MSGPVFCNSASVLPKMEQSHFPWLENNNNDYFSLCLRLGFESLLGWFSLE